MQIEHHSARIDGWDGRPFGWGGPDPGGLEPRFRVGRQYRAHGLDGGAPGLDLALAERRARVSSCLADMTRLLLARLAATPAASRLRPRLMAPKAHLVVRVLAPRRLIDLPRAGADLDFKT
jgi:hypothetical protein